MTIVYTGGTFDLLHPGHIHLLRQCRQMAGEEGRVVVALNTDDFVMSYKGIRLTHDFLERRTMLRSCRYVDLVVTNTGGADSKPTIEAVMPDIVAIGMDWHPKNGRDYMAQMQFSEGWLAARGIILEYLPLLPDMSSTKIRARTRE